MVRDHMIDKILFLKSNEQPSEKMVHKVHSCNKTGEQIRNNRRKDIIYEIDVYKCGWSNLKKDRT